MPVVVHRFEKLIAGHSYQIEVASVDHNRWRAYIVRLPGVPTALMPFYGSTPTDAAGQLCQWLTRIHGRATENGGSVPDRAIGVADAAGPATCVPVSTPRFDVQ